MIAAWFVGLAALAHPSASEITYHRDVEPIILDRCAGCHRPGQVAPFPLLTFAEVRKRSELIATVTQTKRMPPWHASTTEGGPFRDARVLSDREIELIATWVEAGCPEGDPKDAPPPPVFASDWPLGEPDLILTVPAPYTLSADGRDEFRVFVLPTGLTEGKWVTAVDFKPGNRRVVHHILSGFDTTGQAKTFDAADPGSGYGVVAGYGTTRLGLPFYPSGGMSGWAPGKNSRPLPQGVGRYLPAGSDLLLQIHYHKSGKVETDATSIGLYFAKAPVRKQVVGGMVAPPLSVSSGFPIRPKLLIPAGDANHELQGELTLTDDYHLAAVIPHMHWLGKDFTMTAHLPDGSTRALIVVERWDFNWQGTYEFVEPIPLPKGTVIKMLAHFDNSDANPSNPSHPPKDVTWGEQTTNEMCLGFMQLTLDREWIKDNSQPPPRQRSVTSFPRSLRERFRDRDRSQDQSFLDIEGRTIRPFDDPKVKAVALVFVSTDCPIANAAQPELRRLAQAFEPRGIKFLQCHPDPDVTAEAARTHAREYGVVSPVVLDPEQKTVARTGVTTTPEAVVLGRDGQILYQGRIDDQFVDLGRKRTVVTHHDLEDALEEILAGRTVRNPRTKPIGCPIPSRG